MSKCTNPFVVFNRLDEMAAYASLSPEDRLAYDTEVKVRNALRKLQRHTQTFWISFN